MERKIIIDGIEVEGAEADRIIEEAARDLDETGAPRHFFPLGLLAAVVIAFAILAGATGLVVVSFGRGLPRGWSFTIAIVLMFVVPIVAARIYWRFQCRHIRSVMRRNGFDLCMSCGYWLKGLGPDEESCPECGAPRNENNQRA